MRAHAYISQVNYACQEQGRILREKEDESPLPRDLMAEPVAQLLQAINIISKVNDTSWKSWKGSAGGCRDRLSRDRLPGRQRRSRGWWLGTSMRSHSTQSRGWCPAALVRCPSASWTSREAINRWAVCQHRWSSGGPAESARLCRGPASRSLSWPSWRRSRLGNSRCAAR